MSPFADAPVASLTAGGGVPSVLQEVQVPVIENSVCQEMFQTSGHAKNIIGSFLCAGYANGQRDSCEVRAPSLQEMQ